MNYIRKKSLPLINITINRFYKPLYLNSLRKIHSENNTGINIDKNDEIANTEDQIDVLAKEFSKDDMPIDMVNPYERDRKVCVLCKYGIKLDYKNPKLLSQFVSPYTGQLYDQHITRLCEQQQKLLKTEIKKSIRAGFMASMVKNVEFLKDPMLFDPNNPIKPHKY